ncbi:N/A [soil metagenome]
MRRFAPFLALAVLLAGCTTTATPVGGQPRPKRITSVVSLSPSTTELVTTINYTGILKGRTASDNYPKSVETVPVVASVKPDYEQIKTISPGLIVYDASLYNAGDIQKIKELGFDTFAIDANTIDDYTTELYKLGSLLAGETSVSDYIDRVLSSRSSAMGDAPSPKPKVAVILPGSGGEHYIAGTKSFVADVVRASGGEPVGPDADKFVPLSPESIVGQAPDTIVIGAKADNAAAQVGLILNDARLRSLPAIVNKRIIPIDEDVLARRGSRVDKLIDNLRLGFHKQP